MLRRRACSSSSSVLSLLAKYRNPSKSLFRDLHARPEIAVLHFTEDPVLQQHPLKPRTKTQQYPFHSSTVSSQNTPQTISDGLLSSSNSKIVQNPTHKFTIPTQIPLSKTLPRYFSCSFQVPCKNPICQPPYRSFATLPQNAPVLSSRQRKVKERDELEEAFESASTTDEILSTFAAMESAFDATDKKLGLACLKVGQHLDSTGKNPTEALSYANRALEILDRGTTDGGKEPLPVAMALHLLGSVNYSLKRFSESLAYLNKSNRILNSMAGSSEFDVRPVAHAVQLQLANTKTAMGRREEALVNLKKCLELKESIFDPNSKEMGIAYRDLAEAYVGVLNFKEALPLCLKALDIHRALLGSNSVEVAHDRRVLAVIYSGLEEHEKALEENELSQRVLKSWGMSSDLLHGEIEAANIQIALRRYDQAIGTLKGVVQQTDKDSEIRALIFIAVAKALCNQEKFTDSKRYLEISCGVLDKKESESPAKVAEAYAEISMLYETMNEFETAISLLKRAIATEKEG
ncbi:hypothetical protein ACLOJK_015961 [Asimina triloba]